MGHTVRADSNRVRHEEWCRFGWRGPEAKSLRRRVVKYQTLKGVPRMKSFTRKTLFFAVTVSAVLAAQSSSAAPALPNPVLVFTGAEYMVVGGNDVTRYTVDVFNKDAYTADFFAASQTINPCGTNTKVARIRLHIFDHTGKR